MAVAEEVEVGFGAPGDRDTAEDVAVLVGVRGVCHDCVLGDECFLLALNENLKSGGYTDKEILDLGNTREGRGIGGWVVPGVYDLLWGQMHQQQRHRDRKGGFGECEFWRLGESIGWISGTVLVEELHGALQFEN